MRYGEKGEAVRLLQVALEEAGEELPRYGADSHFGSETARALESFARKNGITSWSNRNDPVPEELLDLLGCGEGPDDETELGPVEPIDVGVPVFDLRSGRPNPHPKSMRSSNGKTLVRSIRAIDSIVLHQTGIDFGPKSASDEKLARRALNVACHAMAFQRGFYVLSAPIRWHIYHADRLNSRSLGLEVEGNYPGLMRRAPLNGKPSVMLSSTLEAGRAALRALVMESRREGANIRYLYAHRQADSWRRADPGEWLWRNLVIEYAVPELGLIVKHDETLAHPSGKPSRRGMPVPIDWDPRGKGRY